MDVGVSSEWTWIFDHFRPWRNESFISSGTFTNNQVVASQGQALINLFRPSLMDWGPSQNRQWENIDLLTLDFFANICEEQ